MAPASRVYTENSQSGQWFSRVLLPADPATFEPFSTQEGLARESSVGFLVDVRDSHVKQSCLGIRITYLLFYVTRDDDPTGVYAALGADEQPTSERAAYVVKALPLSSDLLHHFGEAEPTPPPSPTTEPDSWRPFEATLLQSGFHPNVQATELPASNLKRKSAAEVFDEAAERRQKSRRRCGVIADARALDGDASMSLHRRSTSQNFTQDRPLSRSSSVISSRPRTVRAVEVQRSTLSSVQDPGQRPNNSIDTTFSSVELRNKAAISRMVMAGMRLFGLSQSKIRKSLAGPRTPSPIKGASIEDSQAEYKKDEDFKAIYHQTYKGTCFALRSVLDQESVRSEQVQSVVDTLLELFCSQSPQGGSFSTCEQDIPLGKTLGVGD